ncbi:MAG: signal peptidase I [Neisseria sp.]|nr:signal peptidase I [Neisseria sp.]
MDKQLEQQTKSRAAHLSEWAYLALVAAVWWVLSEWSNATAAFMLIAVFAGVVRLFERFRLKRANAKPAGGFIRFMSGFFPIMAAIFLFRAFLIEQFVIPSSSMRPGLTVGDVILVNKFGYGIREPISNRVLISVGKVERGDVAVFQHPEDIKINYIKRVMGIGGDVVEYRNKILRINGEIIPDQPLGMRSYLENTPQYGMINIETEAFRETMDKRDFEIWQMAGQPAFFPQAVRTDFAFRDQCEYAADGSWFRCTVPEGYYFMMGDNRDNSEDSRYWGFVGDKLLVGKAWLVLLNFKDLGRSLGGIR